MISLIARRDMIRDRLTEFVEENLEQKVEVIDPPEWVNETGPNRLFGYRYPVKEGNWMVVGFCPDMIAAYTGALSDESLDAYLDIVEYLIARHIVHYPEYPNDVARAIKADDDLYELKPDAMQFLTKIQMDALDMLDETDEDD